MMLAATVHFLDEEEQRSASKDPKVREILISQNREDTCVHNFFVNSIAHISVTVNGTLFEFEVLLVEWLKALTTSLRVLKTGQSFDLRIHMLVAGENFDACYKRGHFIVPVYCTDGRSKELKINADQGRELHKELKRYLFEMIEVCNVTGRRLADEADYCV